MLRKIIAVLVVFAVALAAASPVILTGGIIRPQSTINERFIVMYDGSLLEREVYDGQTTLTHIMDNVIGVSTGRNHTMVIKADGSLWGWGRNDFGQIGDGTQMMRRDPVHVMDNVVNVAAGASHTMALTADGGLYTWGGNNSGQLGDGTITHDVWAAGGPRDEAGLHNDWLRTIQVAPRRMMDNVISIAAGDSHSMAVTADGGLYTWGNNMDWQLGGGTTTSHPTSTGSVEVRNIPERIMDDVVAVYAVGGMSLAIKTDGSLWAWGRIGERLRIGGRGSRHSRYPVHIIDDVVNFSVYLGSLMFTMVIRSDGSLWAWGRNISGRLGDGTRTDSYFPIHIMDNVIYVSSVSPMAMALTADGTLWTWGGNSDGRLLGGPVQIQTGTDWTTEYRATPYPVLRNVMVPGSAVVIPGTAAAPPIPDAAPPTPAADIIVIAHGTEIVFANPPLTRHGFTFFQVDEILEALADTIHWDSETSTISGTFGYNLVEVQINDLIYIINGNVLDSPPELAPFVEDGVIYVYIDFIVEGLGLSATWDRETRTFSITY